MHEAASAQRMWSIRGNSTQSLSHATTRVWSPQIVAQQRWCIRATRCTGPAGHRAVPHASPGGSLPGRSRPTEGTLAQVPRCTLAKLLPALLEPTTQVKARLHGLDSFGEHEIELVLRCAHELVHLLSILDHHKRRHCPHAVLLCNLLHTHRTCVARTFVTAQSRTCLSSTYERMLH